MQQSRKLRKKEFEIKGDEDYQGDKEKEQKRLEEYIKEEKIKL